MKRSVLGMIALFATTMIMACQGGDPQTPSQSNENQKSEENSTSGNEGNNGNEGTSGSNGASGNEGATDSKADSKTLIVYYSYTNNTEQIVNDLKGMVTADVIEIEPSEKGLNYAADSYKIGSEQIGKINENPNSESSYPGIDAVDPKLENYSTVIIASPLWWSHMASNMQTFLFKYGSQMKDKKIGLIVCSYSSSIETVEKDAKRLVPSGKFMDKSLWINNSNFSKRKSLLESWIKENGI